MGNRVSISFRNKDEESIALFDQWGGMERVTHARAFASKMQRTANGRGLTPLDRLEPGYIMVAYIKTLDTNDDLYVGDMKDPMWGDNDDNGHHVIDLAVTVQVVTP